MNSPNHWTPSETPTQFWGRLQVLRKRLMSIISIISRIFFVAVCVGGYLIYKYCYKEKPATYKVKVEKENSDGSKTKFEAKFTGTAAQHENMNQLIGQASKILSD
jgi:predicted membrane protein